MIFGDVVSTSGDWADFSSLSQEFLSRLFLFPAYPLLCVILSTSFIGMPGHHVCVTSLETASHASHNGLIMTAAVYLTGLATCGKTLGVAFDFLDSLFESFIGVSAHPHKSLFHQFEVRNLHYKLLDRSELLDGLKLQSI